MSKLEKQKNFALLEPTGCCKTSFLDGGSQLDRQSRSRQSFDDLIGGSSLTEDNRSSRFGYGPWSGKSDHYDLVRTRVFSSGDDRCPFAGRRSSDLPSLWRNQNICSKAIEAVLPWNPGA